MRWVKEWEELKMTSWLVVWEMDINDKGEMVTCKSVCPLGKLGTGMELRGQGLGGKVWHSQVQRPWTCE